MPRPLNTQDKCLQQKAIQCIGSVYGNIMSKIADKGIGEKGSITVSGHTDNVPLMFGGNFRDNWDLAAARASSVVQELEKAGNINTDRMKAVSFGESKPIDTNDTSAGREKNRRIEIEINF